jgi:hypothetical protein
MAARRVRIFLCYSSDEREAATRIELALLARGHDVFRDRSDLAAGQEFDATIARSIEESDLFIFLITPASVAQGRYTLSELRMASRKWPNPSTRVLPVLLQPTPLSAIPQYLRAVSFLEPQGDVGAEVADAVEHLRTVQPVRISRRRLAVTSVPIVAAAAAAAWTFGLFGGDAGPTVEPPADRPGHDLLLPPAISGRARAVAGSASGYLVALAQPAALQPMTDDHQPVGNPVALPGEPVQIVEAPTQYFVVTRRADAVVVFNRDDLAVVMTIPVTPPPVEAGRPWSSTVQSVTVSQGALWAVSGGPDGAPALLKHRVGAWQVPTWMGGDYLTIADLGDTVLTGLRLRNVDGVLWAVARNPAVTGGRLYRIMGAIRVDQATGDGSPAECASDVAGGPNGSLLLVSCTNELQQVQVDGSRLVRGASKPTLPVEAGPGTWTDEILAMDGMAVIIAFNTFDAGPGGRPRRTRIARVLDGRVDEISRFDDVAAVSVAASPRAILVVLRRADGSFEAAAVPRKGSS